MKKHKTATKPKRVLHLPKNGREWALASLLTLTIAYLLVGIVFAWRIYVQGVVTPAMFSYYPFPAARVGSTIIPVSRYYRDVNAIKQYMATSGTGQDYPELKIEDEVMQRLIQAAIYERLGHRYGISVTAAEVDQAYQASAAEETEPVEQILKQYYGFTPTDFKIWISEYLLEERVRMEVPKYRTINHILVSVAEGSAEDLVARKLTETQQIMDELKQGKDFAELARQKSNDLTTRDNGGSLGSITRGPSGAPVIDQVFEDTAFSAPLNQIAGPVRSSRGWHVILVTEEKGQIDKNIVDIIKEEQARTNVTKYLNIK